jgi:hypothetical protein
LRPTPPFTANELPLAQSVATAAEMFAVKINPAQKKEINRIAQSFSLRKKRSNKFAFDVNSLVQIRSAV